MTQVDFYVAPEPGVHAGLITACRIIEKAWRLRHAVYVHTADEQLMRELDENLWNFRPNSFLPHRLESEPKVGGENTPDIVIACSGNPGQHEDVLVNLTEEPPQFVGRFARIAEIVQGDEAAKARGRERYKYYRKRGYPLKYHPL